MHKTTGIAVGLALAVSMLTAPTANALPTAPVVAVSVDGAVASSTAPGYTKETPDNSSVLFGFSGEKGQIVGIEAHGVSYIGAIKVWQASVDKVVAIATGSKANVLYLHFVLPGAGSYLVSVVNASSTLTANPVTCQLRSPATSQILLDGPAVSAQLVPSRSAVFTFTGTAGQVVGLDTFKQDIADDGGLQLSLVQDSTGKVLATDRISKAEKQAALSATLPAAGSFRLVASPTPATDSYSGAISTRLISPTLGAIAIDQGPVVNSIVPSQSLVLTFTGLRHQVAGLFITKLVPTRDGDLDVSVIQLTTGLEIASDVMLHNDAATALALDLPGNSQYQIVITPKNAHGYVHRGAISAELKSPVPLELAGVGIAANADLTPGQSAIFSFSGKKSELFGIVIDKTGFEKDFDFNVRVTELRSGRDLATDTLRRNDVQSSVGLVLPSTGNYVVVVTPRNPSIFTGRITATTKAPAVLAVKRRAPAKIALTVGQGALFSFSASRGQTMTLRVAKQTLVREAVLRVLVVNARTGAIVSTGTLAINSLAYVGKLRFPSTGRYRIIVLPASPVASYSGGVAVSLR